MVGQSSKEQYPYTYYSLFWTCHNHITVQTHASICFNFLDVIKESTKISAWGSDLTLSCEFTGYHPKDEYTVTWDLEGKIISQDSRKYTISNQFGTNGLSQSGGSFPGPSLISSLTIFSVEQADIGIYGCRIIGSVGCSQVIGYIQVSTGIHICLHMHACMRVYSYAYIHRKTHTSSTQPSNTEQELKGMPNIGRAGQVKGNITEKENESTNIHAF